jgi:Ca-activated chloride channel family protein
MSELNNFSFQSPVAFWILILLFFLLLIKTISKSYENIFSKDMLNKIIVGKSKKNTNFILLFIAFILIVLSLARPVIQNEPIKISTKSLSLVIAFDISKSMICEDVYPNRLSFAKNKFTSLLKNLKDEKVGVIGFSSKSFLIAPITNDYLSLKYLVQNMSTSYISVNGSDIFEALRSTNNLLKNSKQKALIILSDGTDTNDFSTQIQYANDNNIKVFIYAIATRQGGVIKTKDDIQKDKDGNIVVTRLNDNIKDLALETNGAYLEFTNKSNDIKEFVNIIRKKFKEKEKKEIIINTNQELYYFPLTLAFILIFIAISGFKRRI